jgi:ABC-type phosphate transport system ATPase subunit
MYRLKSHQTMLVIIDVDWLNLTLLRVLNRINFIYPDLTAIGRIERWKEGSGVALQSKRTAIEVRNGVSEAPLFTMPIYDNVALPSRIRDAHA